MQKRNLLQLVLMAFLAICVQSGAYAHSALKSSSPEKGSTVSSPSMLMLTFNDAVRLVKFELKGDAGAVDTGFAAKPAANTMFHIPVPALSAGAYEVTWSILGGDGHAVSESFGFNVDPNAPAAVMNHGDASTNSAMPMNHGSAMGDCGAMNHDGHSGMDHGNHGQGNNMNHGAQGSGGSMHQGGQGGCGMMQGQGGGNHQH
ncbi:MAG: copper resistance protein CopC [Pseudohongiellaceae bacterium]|nr:copper resistance protein CopC [Pseudohongiellaceae bacterium]